MKRIARCQHIKINGTQCGSPAMRGRRLCYFHLNASTLQTFRMGDPRCITPYTLPLLEDAESIQIALMRVTDMIVKNLLQPKQAGLILYALQTASYNLTRSDFQPRVSSVVISKEMTRDTPLSEDPLDELMFGPDEDEEEDQEAVEQEEKEEQERARPGRKETAEQEEDQGEAQSEQVAAGIVRKKEEPKKNRKREPETVEEWLADILPSGTLPS
jgi:hypothetical protein